MARNRSKQATLLGSWGYDNKQKTSVVAPTAYHEEKIEEESDHLILDEVILNDFFTDDIANETSSDVKEKENRKSNLHNSSLYEDIPGFDYQAGEVYIYPTNYTIRDYQFNIVKKCLYKNTLVSLPTGLGKTFIAAVVMYNFYRWYPNMKVVFLAPTKPLVAQQIEACFGIMGIPQAHTAEMTGSMAPKDRINQWQIKRVFFLTPQVMQNDLARGTCPATEICCIVFDEAHKALGNHAYCQVVKELSNAGAKYRILALSATPGSDLKAVQQVITNLQIGHIEIRSEESLDIQQYIHERKVEKIVVPLDGEISEVITSFKKILVGVVSRLAKLDLIYHTDVDRLSKFQMLQARENFRKTAVPGPETSSAEGDFALSISLFHAYELLLQHGMKSFYTFLHQTISEGYSRAKMELSRNRDFNQILSQLRERISSTESVSPPSMNSSMYCPTIKLDVDFFYSHPKLKAMEDVVLSHFKNHHDTALPSTSCESNVTMTTTRVMIFSQYRESVREIADMLSRHAPLIRVMSFIGHSTTGKSNKGQSQKEQVEVVRKFRHGGYNCLVSTCVGEEGLDIGEVDLIVCFDAHKSPVRLVQRMGRTGRKRQGRIVVIVGQGKEEQIYNKGQSNKSSIHRAIRDGSKSLTLCPFTPRMVPRHMFPEVRKVHMEVGEFVGKGGTSHKPTKRNQDRLSFGLNLKNDPKGVYLTSDELRYWHSNFALPDIEAGSIEQAMKECLSHKPLIVLNTRGEDTSINMPSCSVHMETNKKTKISLDHWIVWQTAPTRTHFIGHSSSCDTLRNVLQFTDHLQMNPDLAQSYEMEMKAFINEDDFLIDEKEQETKKPYPPKNKRHVVRVISDSSDDEDFRPVNKKLESTESNENETNKSPNLHRNNEMSPNDRVSPIVPNNRVSPINSVPLVTDDPVLPIDINSNDGVLPTIIEDDVMSVDDFEPPATQSVVPCPPTMDTLNWLDDFMASQKNTSTSLQDPSFIYKSQTEIPKDQSESDPIQDRYWSVSDSIPTRHQSESGNVPGRHQFEFDSIPARHQSESGTASSEHQSIVPDEHQSEPIPTECQSQSSDSTRSLVDHDLMDNFEDIPSAILFDDEDNFEEIELIKNQIRENELECTVIPESPERPSLSSHMEPMTSLVPTGGHTHHHLYTPNKPYLSNIELTNNLFKSPIPLKSPRNIVQTPCTTSTPKIVKVAQQLSIQTPDSEDRLFRQVNNRKRPIAIRQPDFLCSLVPPTKTKPPIKTTIASNMSFEDSDDDDDFMIQPLMKRIKGRTCPEEHKPHLLITDSRRKETDIDKVEESNNFIEEEAEEVDTDPAGQPVCKGVESESSNEYDYDDSFINDNSVLTQHVNTAATITHNVTKSPLDMGAVYQRSLMSPDNLFAGKKRGHGNQYKLVLSQRYKILNHYIKKAHLNVSSETKRSHQRRRQRNDSGSEAEEDYMARDEPELADSEDDGMSQGFSPLEEEEDDETELPRRSSFLQSGSTDLTAAESSFNDSVCVKKKRVKLPDSLLDSPYKEISPVKESVTEAVETIELVEDDYVKSLLEVDSNLLEDDTRDKSRIEEGDDFVLEVEDCYILDEAENMGIVNNNLLEDNTLQCQKISHLIQEGVIVSPSLIVEVPDNAHVSEEFRLGMGEWTDSETERDESILDSNLECSFLPTQEEMELFLAADDDSTDELDYHSNEYTEDTSINDRTAISSSNPQNGIESINGMGTCPVRSNTMAVSSSSVKIEVPETKKIAMLVDSREVTTSQLVSLLRHKHGVDIKVCSLGHSGYVVSNRAVVERKLQSDLSSVSSKLLPKLQSLEKSYHKVYLLIEEDEKTKTTKLKSQGSRRCHWEKLLAAITMSTTVTIVYSSSQESSASLLLSIANLEAKKGHAITVPFSLLDKADNNLKLLLKVPQVNLITALNLLTSYPDLATILTSSSSELKFKVPHLTTTQAQTIVDFFNKQFSSHLLS